MTSPTTHDHVIGWELIETTVMASPVGSFRLILGRHPRHGRVFLIEGFGGLDSLHGVRGGGDMAERIADADDTLASLWEPIDRPPYCRDFERRDRLDWNGSAIRRIAANMGY